MDTFKRVEISGDAQQRGAMHGEQLRAEIGEALEFYRSVFGLSDNKVLARGAYFARVIEDFNPDYASEIRAIAGAAGQDPLWLFALNARTEILALGTQKPSNECTTVCFSGPPVLGQTWDWGQPLEALCAIMRIERPDGHVIMMLGEPGIIGKIGMNSAGVGVCLNILSCGEPLDGVPVHVLLRAVLDCGSSEQARAMIAGANTGTASNLAIADAGGTSFDVEFAGSETLAPGTGGDTFAHTNHYLGRTINRPGDPEFDNSRARLDVALERLAAGPAATPGSLKDILSDRSHPEFPIYRPYTHSDELGLTGTVATIVMDFAAGTLHVRKGNDAGAQFSAFDVQ